MTTQGKFITVVYQDILIYLNIKTTIRYIFTIASLALVFAKTNAENWASGNYGYTAAYDYIIVGAGASRIIAAQRFVE